MEYATNRNCLSGARFGFLSHFYYNLYRFRLPIMKRLVDLGAEVFALSPPPGYSSELFREHGVAFVPLDMRGFAADPVRDLLAVTRLARLLKALRLDVLQTFTLKGNILGAWAGRRARTPNVICTVTGMGGLYVPDGSVKTRLLARSADRLMRHALRDVSAVVVQNPDDHDELVRRGLARRDRIRLILSSGIDLDEFSRRSVDPGSVAALRKEWGLGEADTVVTMIAYLLPAKGVREYVAAARELAGRARFVLIGRHDTGRRASISSDEVAAWERTGTVVLPGFQKNIQEWLALSDIYTLPSYYREGVPRTNLEAMAMQLPVVTTDAPGCRETVVHGDNGLLIPPRDADALIGALRRLIDEPELRRRMGIRSRELARSRFSVESVVDQHLALYKAALG